MIKNSFTWHWNMQFNVFATSPLSQNNGWFTAGIIEDSFILQRVRAHAWVLKAAGGAVLKLSQIISLDMTGNVVPLFDVQNQSWFSVLGTTVPNKYQSILTPDTPVEDKIGCVMPPGQNTAYRVQSTFFDQGGYIFQNAVDIITCDLYLTFKRAPNK